MEGGTRRDDFLKKCTGLKHLSIYNDALTSVAFIKCPLESLKLNYIHEESVAPILDLLNSDIIAVRGLKLLTVLVEDPGGEGFLDDEAQEEAESFEGWSDVEEACRRRKIELIVKG